MVFTADISLDRNNEINLHENIDINSQRRKIPLYCPTRWPLLKSYLEIVFF
jgi:hypothetical protein